MEIDNKKYEHKTYSVLIANTRMYGTGAIVNPEGNPHDGTFEIVLLTKRDWSGVINLGLTAFDKKAIETFKGYTKIYSAKSAKVKFDKPRMLQLDGEVIGKCDSIESEIIPIGFNEAVSIFDMDTSNGSNRRAVKDVISKWDNSSSTCD